MTTSAQQAAHILVARRLQGRQGERLPNPLRPTNIDSALAIQAAVTAQWCEQMDDSIGAWKCGLPSQNKLIVAPIFTRTIDSVPPISLWPKEGVARIEPELAFFLGVDLPPRHQPYTPSEIDAAIVRTHLALELIHSRYSHPEECSFAEMLADSLVNQGLFVGPEVNAELAGAACDFNINVSCSNGESWQYQAHHPSQHPRAPLYWLVEFLRSQGKGILAGQAVITGSFAGVIEVPLNTDICIEYANLGQMQVSFNAKG